MNVGSIRPGLFPRFHGSNRELLALAISCLLHAGALLALPPGGGGGHALPGRIEARLRPPELAQPASGGETAPLAEPLPGQEKGTDTPGGGDTDDSGPPGPLPQTDEIYYPPEHLSKQPRPLTEPDLGRHDIADADFVGPARLRLWISRGGKVVDVAVEGDGVPAGLQAALRESFMLLVFSPGEIGGKAVSTSLRIEVDFAGPPGEAPR